MVTINHNCFVKSVEWEVVRYLKIIWMLKSWKKTHCGNRVAIKLNVFLFLSREFCGLCRPKTQWSDFHIDQHLFKWNKQMGKKTAKNMGKPTQKDVAGEQRFVLIYCAYQIILVQYIVYFVLESARNIVEKYTIWNLVQTFNEYFNPFGLLGPYGQQHSWLQTKNCQLIFLSGLMAEVPCKQTTVLQLPPHLMLLMVLRFFCSIKF